MRRARSGPGWRTSASTPSGSSSSACSSQRGASRCRSGISRALRRDGALISTTASRHMARPAPDSPPPAYVSSQDGLLEPAPRIYGPIADATQKRKLVQRFVIPPRSGRAWELPAGHVCRFSPFEGPQVLDLNPVSYTHLRAHETGRNLVCRLLLEQKK